MNRSIRLTLLSAAIGLLPYLSQGAVIAGYHSFDSNVDTTPDAIEPGFTSSLTLPGFLAGYGSTDGTYGDGAEVTGQSVPAPGNGSADVGPAANPGTATWVITNNGATTYQLAALLLDGGQWAGYNSTLTVTANGPQGITSFPAWLLPTIPTDLVPSDWVGTSYDLSAYSLAPSESLTLTLTSTVGGGIDNLAVTGAPVPEPSAALLGSLAASVLVLRRRFR